MVVGGVRRVSVEGKTPLRAQHLGGLHVRSSNPKTQNPLQLARTTLACLTTSQHPPFPPTM
jgi:hypothetical protein